MDKRLALAAVAALTLAAAPALAEPPQSPDISKGPALSALPQAVAGADAGVTTGMDVKDKTGATIGKVTEVTAGADDKQTATVKMGADAFAVDAASLTVAAGAATVNASEAEIRSMLKARR